MAAFEPQRAHSSADLVRSGLPYPKMKPTNRSVPFLFILLAATATTSLSGADTATLWKNRCAKCHGDDGRGDTKEGRKLYISDLTDPKLQAKFTDDEALQAIKLGLKDAKGKMIMKPVRGVSDEEAKALVAHVRSLKR